MERSGSWQHMLGTWVVIALVLLTFTYGTKIWGAKLKNSHWITSHVKVHSSTTYHILLAKFRELPMDLCALKLTTGFQQRFAHLPFSWLVNKATSLSQQPSPTRILHLVQINNHVEDIVGFISLGNPWQPNLIKNNKCGYQGDFSC